MGRDESDHSSTNARHGDAAISAGGPVDGHGRGHEAGRGDAPGAGRKKHEGAAVVSALISNVGVGLAKIVTFLVTGSQSMMAEGLHSIADSSNEVTLLLGKRLSHEHPSRKHPFGTSRARYLASFVVAVMLFAAGGLYSTVESGGKVVGIIRGTVTEPAAPWWHHLMALLVVVVSFCLEGWSLHRSYLEAKERAAITGWEPDDGGRFHANDVLDYWRETKSSDLASVIAEDSLACTGLVFAGLGVVLTWVTGDPVWDALGGLMVGLLLLFGAAFLGWRVTSLLIGEGCSERTYDLIDGVIESDPAVQRRIYTEAMHLSEDVVLLCAKIEIRNDDGTDDPTVINRIERAIRSKVHWYRFHIYIEVDHYDPSLADGNPVD